MLNTITWKPMRVGDLFTSYTGGDLILSNLHEGPIPVISHSIKNNSIGFFSLPIEGQKLFNSNTALALSDRGNFRATVQKDDFYIGTRVKALEAKFGNCNKRILSFIATVINNESFRFCYGRNCTGGIDDLLISLPSFPDGTPNYEYMDSYIKAINQDVATIPDYFLNEGYDKACWYMDNINQDNFERYYGGKYCEGTVKFRPCDNSTWSEFKVGGKDGLFDVMPGKRLTKSDQHEGMMPFLGATKYNNGITGYISEEPLYSGPCLTINYNGSVAEAFYQSSAFWNSDDVKAWIPRYKFNVFIAMFLIVIIRLQQQHYFYGRKWSQESMEKTIIKLPYIYDDTGKKVPDWDYMEQYIKSLPFSKNIKKQLGSAS